MHETQETAIYALSGDTHRWYGEQLEHQRVVREALAFPNRQALKSSQHHRCEPVGRGCRRSIEGNPVVMASAWQRGLALLGPFNGLTKVRTVPAR